MYFFRHGDQLLQTAKRSCISFSLHRHKKSLHMLEMNKLLNQAMDFCKQIYFQLRHEHFFKTLSTILWQKARINLRIEREAFPDSCHKNFCCEKVCTLMTGKVSVLFDGKANLMWTILCFSLLCGLKYHTFNLYTCIL